MNLEFLKIDIGDADMYIRSKINIYVDYINDFICINNETEKIDVDLLSYNWYVQKKHAALFKLNEIVKVKNKDNKFGIYIQGQLEYVAPPVGPHKIVAIDYKNKRWCYELEGYPYDVDQAELMLVNMTLQQNMLLKRGD